MKKALLILGNFFIVILLTSISIFCMEPEIIDKKLPMTPTEAFADIGKYMAICLTFFAIARLMLGKNIKPQCEKLFVDMDKRVKHNADILQTFMMEMSTKFTVLSKQYDALEKTVSGQTNNIEKLGDKIDHFIELHFKKK